MRTFKLGALLAVTLTMLMPDVSAELFTGECTLAITGDTIHVGREGKAVKTHLYGLLAPQNGEAFAKESRAMCADLAVRHQLTVMVVAHQGDGAISARVVLPNGKSLNSELVRLGAAAWDVDGAPGEAPLGNAMREARAEKRGMWASANAGVEAEKAAVDAEAKVVHFPAKQAANLPAVAASARTERPEPATASTNWIPKVQVILFGTSIGVLMVGLVVAWMKRAQARRPVERMGRVVGSNTAIHIPVITIGMTRRTVTMLLGEPQIERAGDAMFKALAANYAEIARQPLVAREATKTYALYDHPAGQYNLVFQDGRVIEVHQQPG